MKEIYVICRNTRNILLFKEENDDRNVLGVFQEFDDLLALSKF